MTSKKDEEDIIEVCEEIEWIYQHGTPSYNFGWHIVPKARRLFKKYSEVKKKPHGVKE